MHAQILNSIIISTIYMLALGKDGLEEGFRIELSDEEVQTLSRVVSDYNEAIGLDPSVRISIHADAASFIAHSHLTVADAKAITLVQATAFIKARR